MTFNTFPKLFQNAVKVEGDKKIYFKDAVGQKWLIEIKPKKQCQPPVKPSRKTKRYLNEVMTYVKNQSKWDAASKWADARGYRFAIWHEDTLKQLGIKILKG